MGPWCHGCWARGDGDHLGNVWFGARTGPWYREHIEFPFFEYYLKGKSDPKVAEATVFETGTNEWKYYDQWPPKNAKKISLYLGPDGKLLLQPPTSGSGYDEYVSDPWKPVPFTSEMVPGMSREHMTDDQRLAGRRTDVLVYQTDPLPHDVTFSGPINPSLFVSTSGTDSDFVVKLIDVYPEDYPDAQPNPREIHMAGYEQLVRGELFRGRFRNSFEKPEPFEPNKVTKIAYEMPDINHTFRTGHRIMVQIQSTWLER